MTRLLLALVLAGAAAAVAALVRRRRAVDAPSQPMAGWVAPAQLDRSDFARPDAPWLVALFTSATCDSCRSTVAKAAVLETSAVVVDVVEVGERAEVHRRYGIEAVPMVCIAGGDGVVVRSFVGPMSATDLWAAVARARDPSLPLGYCESHGHEDGPEG
jgi:hypothetical protein